MNQQKGIYILLSAILLVGILDLSLTYLHKEKVNNDPESIKINGDSNKSESKQIPRLSLMPVGEGPRIGDQSAIVSMIVFIDYECPFCKQFLAEQFSFLNENYVEKGMLSIHFRNIPRDHHEYAPRLAKYAQYAHRQDSFQQFLERILNPEFDAAGFVSENESLLKSALDENQFLKQMEDSRLMAKVAGITGTPAFVISGRILQGLRSQQELAQLINYAYENPEKMKRDKPASGSCN